MAVVNTSHTSFTDRRTLDLSESPVAFYGHGRQRLMQGDEQSCYNAPKWNGEVDAVFRREVTITRIHRGGVYNGWFSVREHGGQKRTFYVDGSRTHFKSANETLSEWWTRVATVLAD